MQQSKEGNAAQVLQGYGCAYFVIWYWDLDSDKKKQQSTTVVDLS